MAVIAREPRLDSFAALAGGGTHEMSNLLAIVLMSVEMLRGHDPSPAARQVLDGLEETTWRGLAVTRQLQWLATGVDGSPTLFQPGYLMADLQALASATFSHSIVVTASYPPDLWLLEGDPLLLYQSLLDLLLAGRAALDGGGTIELAARNAALTLEAGGAGEKRCAASRHVVFAMTARRAEPAAASRSGDGSPQPDSGPASFERQLRLPAVAVGRDREPEP